MSHFAGWISPDVMQMLGWTLVHFLWQGIALGALAAIGMALCRSAATRYTIGVASLAFMLAAPVVTFTILWSSRSAITPQGAPTTVMSHLVMRAPWFTAVSSNGGPTTIAEAAPFTSHQDVLLWFVEIWFAGVVILSLRTAGGVLLIERMRRREAKLVSARIRQICLAVQWRLGIMRAIRYCESTLLDAPAVIGWLRPAVLLPVTALTGLSDEQLRAIIAHELAHIRRFDNVVNVFQILVETLLFYHPAVWWVSKRVRFERENCCDDAAVSVCDDAMQYAKALTAMAELRTAPALAMAANRGPLAQRIARLLGATNQRSGARNAGVAAGFVLLAGAALAGNAFFGIAHTAWASALPVYGNNNFTTRPPAIPPAAAAKQQEQEQRDAEPQPQEQRAAEQNPQENASPAGKTSYIEAMKAAGLENLTADQVIGLKIQGVTPEYVRGLHDLGLKPNADEVIGLKVQGITADYIRDMRAAGVNADVDTFIGLKVQGVTPDYVRAMHDLGITTDADELIGLKVQGVNPEYVKEMRELGISAKADEIIGMKVQGVTPDYVKQMRALGIAPDADELIGLKVQGVSPDYIKQMHDLRMPAKTDELIGMRVQGVTTDYIQQMRAMGLQLTPEQVIGMKVQGVTPDYVKEMRATGLPDFKDDPDCYIGAKVQGITPEFVAEAQKHDFKDLDLDKLIALKNAGVF